LVCFFSSSSRNSVTLIRFFRNSLWNPSESKVLFSEIKGPGDKLSETQKVWIDVLLSSGVGVEVCRVVESRKLDRANASEEEDDEEEDDSGSGDGKGKKRKRGKSTRARSRSTSKPVKKRAKTEEISLDDDDDD